MKGKHRSKTTLTALVILALVASSALAFAGGAFALQPEQSTATDSSPAPQSSDATTACDGDGNYSLPANCDVSITVVPEAVDKEDDLASFIVRNEGKQENVTVTYETSEGETGTIHVEGQEYVVVNASDNGSVTFDVYYDGELATSAQSDTDHESDLGPSNDDSSDETDNSSGDETDDSTDETDDSTDETDDSTQDDSKESDDTDQRDC
ncbi:hypothetical protein [Halorussus halophilus]|uniref:hypothetical protein n=1 Tax=Halorussus halophilus TaxID=2650975 RepID=UPI0013010239|nr:hypothetical protein [Halorussus halophilus]